jgi:hypothetical protein
MLGPAHRHVLSTGSRPSGCARADTRPAQYIRDSDSLKLKLWHSAVVPSGSRSGTSAASRGFARSVMSITITFMSGIGEAVTAAPRGSSSDNANAAVVVGFGANRVPYTRVADGLIVTLWALSGQYTVDMCRGSAQSRLTS